MDAEGRRKEETHYIQVVGGIKNLTQEIEKDNKGHRAKKKEKNRESMGEDMDRKRG